MNGKAGAAAMAAVLAMGIGGASATAGGAKDHVSGGGSNGNPTADNHFSINALSDSDGSNAKGKFEFHDTESGPPTERFTAEVRCLRVAGNLATVVGRITNARPNSALEGRHVIVRLEDNGPPRKGESRDEIRNAIGTTTEPACPPPADIADRGLSNGNITINDAN